MNPGRELDALIARRAFGMTYEFLHGDYLKQDPEDAVAYDVCPHYSTSILAAWEIVQKLLDMGKPIRLHANLSGVWSAWCWPETSGEVYADTAPHAICLIALRHFPENKELL